jgi:hypothetical protein
MSKTKLCAKFKDVLPLMGLDVEDSELIGISSEKLDVEDSELISISSEKILNLGNIKDVEDTYRKHVLECESCYKAYETFLAESCEDDKDYLDIMSK